MKAATLKQLKDDLKKRPHEELLEICLRLTKFKKDNKELLTYLLFEADDEAEYIRELKLEMDQQFAEVNRQNAYFIKKGIRKILNQLKKHIRYSQQKETEIQLLLYFCKKLRSFQPSISRNSVLVGIFDRQIRVIEKQMRGLHEDLQYDYSQELERIGFL